MKNRFWSLFGLLACVAVLTSLWGRVASARLICNASGNCFTRTTNPPTNDIWSVGGQVAGNLVKAYTEIVLDYTGSLYPTSTLGSQTLGTSTFPWLNLYAATVTSGAGGLANTSGPVGTLVASTTTIAASVYPVGAIVTAQESVSGTVVTNAYNVCQSTKAEAGDSIYIIVSTGVIVGGGGGGGTAGAVVGQKCNG